MKTTVILFVMAFHHGHQDVPTMMIEGFTGLSACANFADDLAIQLDTERANLKCIVVNK